MVLRNRYFLLYLACAVLLGIPSFVVWFREPFLVTKDEFDFFLGLFAASFDDLNPTLAMLGKGAHLLLVVLMGWAYYRLITELGETDAPLKWCDLVIPAALALTISFFYLPWHSPDAFFYCGTGWLEAHYGLNPYTHTIADVPDLETDSAFRNVFPVWRYIITPYGPLFVKYIGAVTYLANGDDRIALLLLKVTFALCHLLSAYFVAGIARSIGFKDRLAALLYLLSPVPLLDYIGWGHNDILMLTCLLGGVWAMLDRRPILAALFFGIGAGLKYVPVVICPYLFLYMTRGKSLTKQVPWVLGLSLLLGVVMVAPNLWYENGLQNISRLFRGQDQQFHNVLYWFTFLIVRPDTEEGGRQLKLLLKLIFLALGALIAYRLWRRGAAMTTDHLFASIVVMLLLYFTVGSPEIHEWYSGWFVCFIFWINKRAYYNLGMVLTTALNALAIYEVRCPPSIMYFAWSLCFMILWAGLYYLWKHQQAKEGQPSPLSYENISRQGAKAHRKSTEAGDLPLPIGALA